MMPKFTDITSWEQAELLMQPAFIRVIDQIRKQLDESSWKGTYQDVLIWPEGTLEETKTTFTILREQLASASPEEASEIEQALVAMPNPYPGYRLCLKHQDQQVTVDLWELCYQVCFRNYDRAIAHPENQQVQIDTSLIEEDTGDVDWNLLDAKARQLVEKVFADLPAA
ncbi:hypothetical protein [Coleofasciculus sp. H7-2]|uniref:hypothetical protein n=1 Tax=Coleofasciculus sp. H7-2 TaxID=3351545 RepID=UPI0036706EDE